MITPQIIHQEPEHEQNLLAELPDVPENMRNHYPYQHHQMPPQNKYKAEEDYRPPVLHPPKYKLEQEYRPPVLPEMKYKSEPDYQQQQQNAQPDPSQNSQTPLKKPKKEVDSTKAYKCNLCEYSFNRRDHLTRHSLVHTKLKPYHCTYCSKDFTRNDHLRRHQQRVHGEETAAAASMIDITQRFICQDCKAIFTSSGHLRVHMENKHHNDFSDFINHHPQDQQSPRKIQSLDTSFVIVDGKKRPVCQLCNKSFSKKDHLTRHINNLHAGMTPATFENFTPEQSFNCNICGKRFSRPEFLRRHLDDAHNHVNQMEILNQLNPNNPYSNGQGNASIGMDPLFPVPPPHMSSMFGLPSFENVPPPLAPKPIKTERSPALKSHSCGICSKNFTRRYHLTRHQKSLHGGVFDNPPQ